MRWELVLHTHKQSPGTQKVTQSMKRVLDKLCPLTQERGKESWWLQNAMRKEKSYLWEIQTLGLIMGGYRIQLTFVQSKDRELRG